MIDLYKMLDLFEMVLKIECKHTNSSYFICQWVWMSMSFCQRRREFVSTLLVFFPLLSTLLYCILFLHRRYVNGCRCSSNVKPHIMNARINGNPYTPTMQIQFVWMIWTKWSWNHLKSCGEVNLKSICFQTHFTYNILLWPIR